MMQHPELTLEERLEIFTQTVRDLERVLENFAVEVEKRFDEVDKNLRLLVADGRANNQRISIVETRLDDPNERPTLPSPESK